MSPQNIQALCDISYEYGKLYRKHPEKREEVRDRWEKFCEQYAPGFEVSGLMHMRFKEGCFANIWS